MGSEKRFCQYCKKEFDNDVHKRTDEHIIPNGLIGLFPEQYVSFTETKKFIDNRGITISDVCKKCNGKLLSPLDEYGKYLIHDNFLKKISVDSKDQEFFREFDYNKLSRWLLKILFNYQRSKKENTLWFQRALDYMLYGLTVERIYFSIFAGIHINTTPLPEEYYEYKPLQIFENPKLLGNSLAVYSLGIDPFINSLEVKSAFSTFCIRFGTAIIYVILWESDVEVLTKEYFNKLMTHEFNFVHIVPSIKDYYLKRVSAHTNTVMGYWHLISNSGIIQDDVIVKRNINNKSLSECQDYFYKATGNKGIEETKTLIEMLEFSGNKKVQKKYKQFFGED